MRGWERKLSPQFLQGAAIYRKGVEGLRSLGKNPPAELIREVNDKVQRQLVALMKDWPGETKQQDAVWDTIHVAPPELTTRDQALMERLHWARYREPLWQTVQRAEDGDLEAQKRIHRTELDYQRARFGKGHEIAAPKGDPDHRVLLQFGLSLGLDKLTSEELADCFEAVCPCGKPHDTDALKKQRARLLKALEEARRQEHSWKAKPAAALRGGKADRLRTRVDRAGVRASPSGGAGPGTSSSREPDKRRRARPRRAGSARRDPQKSPARGA